MITNKTTNKTISEKEIICKSFFSQARGLMFRKKRNLIMVFPQERKIKLHNFFVFYPIDVLVLDKDMKIIEIKRNFRPFTFWNSEKRGRYVVELSKSCDSKIGDLFYHSSFH